MRPGDYYALAFAEPGGVPQLDDSLIRQAGKVTVHVDETVSADLRAARLPAISGPAWIDPAATNEFF